MNDLDANEFALELRLRTWAIPLALIAARLLVSTGPGRFLTRVLVGMWVHEIGHALAAWLCGFIAFPGPWLTPMSNDRSPGFAILLGLALMFFAYRAWQAEEWKLSIIWIAILLIHTFCYFGLSLSTAKQLIYFSGDGGDLVLGSALMCTVYTNAESEIHKGWLRWGFLAIGAGAFMDVFEQWWAAQRDVDRIPFGMNEGAGLSDPSVLSDVYGWSASTIVHRYVVLGCVCLGALSLLYAVQLFRARAAVEAEHATETR